MIAILSGCYPSARIFGILQLAHLEPCLEGTACTKHPHMLASAVPEVVAGPATPSAAYKMISIAEAQVCGGTTGK